MLGGMTTRDLTPYLDLPDTPLTRAQLSRLGISKWQLHQLLRAGILRRALTEVYVPAQVPDTIELRARAASLVLPRHAVMVDGTAAWLWGIDLVSRPGTMTVSLLEIFVLRGHTRVRRNEASGGERDLLPREVVEIEGVRVTTPLRTALDLACSLSRFEALAMLDALARTHRFTSRQLTLELVRRYRGRRGVVQARELVQLVTPLAESTGESFTRLVIHDEGLPLPQPQCWVYDDGVPVYRLDLAYEGLKICIEYDGEEFHSSEKQKKRDRRRRTWLREHGWWVIVVTKHSFKGPARDQWLGELRRALEERS
jgi:hypothetical protein